MSIRFVPIGFLVLDLFII